MEFSNCEK